LVVGRWPFRSPFAVVGRIPIYNADVEPKVLTCGCRVEVSRDFLGRNVGTIVTKGDGCARPDHQPGRVVVMPGRENAGG
jgi:hypothetical protein